MTTTTLDREKFKIQTNNDKIYNFSNTPLNKEIIQQSFLNIDVKKRTNLLP